MMNDEQRPGLEWSVRYVEPGERDHIGAVIPKGWWVCGFEQAKEEAVALIHVAQHESGHYAAASLAAVTSQLLNGFENVRQVSA